MKPFFVYILRCADGSYYVGHADDLDARINAHVAGKFDSYTRKRRPVALVHASEFPTRDEAFLTERRIKGCRARRRRP